MSSLIPKISIGRDTKKGSHFDLSSMTHTTSEIGYVQPTFSKFLVPNSSVRIGTRTGVRLSPLYVPTMGEIDVRHYHDFIPFNTLWFPFDAFITKTNYTLPSGSTYIPEAIPHFSVKDLFSFIFNEFGVTDGKWLDLQNDLVCTIYVPNTQTHSYDALASSVVNGQTNDIFVSPSEPHVTIYPRTIYQPDGDNYVRLQCQDNASGEVHILPYGVDSWHVIPTPDACDFCYQAFYYDNSGDAHPCLMTFNFCGAVKRLRTAFLGLGYSFNPFDTEQVTPLALLAYYKMYWEHFGVNRTFNFFNTNCYKVIKYLSDHIVGNILRYDSGSPEASTLFTRFVVDLANMTYTCAPDYFSSADIDTQRSATNMNGVSISSPQSQTSREDFSIAWNTQTASADMYHGHADPVHVATNPSNPLGQKIALRLLRFINKNSVIGRQVSEILRVRYGVSDIHNTTHEDVIKVGASSCPIEISAVYNNTDSGDMPLGSYAGLGVGSRRSKMFKFHTDSFGIVITMTAVVPKMGYWQGMLRENSDGVNGAFDFYIPEYDAIGWQAVRYNELVADRQHDFTSQATVTTDLGIFGFQPFYSHLKVGHNRCLADISLPRLRESMLPYTLDRYFPDHERYENGMLGESLLPPNDPQTFRSGTQGKTNRIFSDYAETDDHVIMQIFFDVKMTAPMKSLSTSYDTWDEESTSSVDVSHE